VIAGLSGDAGKTLVTVGLTCCCATASSRSAGFKKGPDYIDAAGSRGRPGNRRGNLDTWSWPDLARAAFVERGIDEG